MHKLHRVLALSFSHRIRMTLVYMTFQTTFHRDHKLISRAMLQVLECRGMQMKQNIVGLGPRFQLKNHQLSATISDYVLFSLE